ncbi:ribonucleoside-triphosphate reductase [Ignicoccus islandicus DSM 13165]|uniref:Ribonucleoside-triphosphate reductase n=1 Tax=Ignicoccus islandicus DSM 13165 TaxID=940295 RepID=A0A0U3FPT6_9CREN|nr:anaerobic ribonucleoside-triphosphate reductase activating protein [Ignicoccus islandicus]ALU11943.1 ribonucleoside-triphosphate reductase [Ignicoccus islandicus DSM 13165]
MLIAGWKPFSLVDVVGKVTFTTWACGCNLKCPFCHNWRTAEWQGCVELPVSKFEEELKDASDFVDLLHLTGGEPTLQPKLVTTLSSIAKKVGVPFSLNTNCTTKQSIELIEVADHVATDIKVPYQELYGLNGAFDDLWNTFLKCIEKLASMGKEVELRIPVAKDLTKNYLNEIKRIISMFDPSKVTVVVNPLVTEPLTDPRDKEWCSKYCYKGNMESDEENMWREEIGELGVKVKVKRWLN